MADVAFLDLEDLTTTSSPVRTVAVLGDIDGDVGTRATFAALRNGLMGIDVTNSQRATEADAIIVLEPEFANRRQVARLARLALGARLRGKPVVFLAASAWGAPGPITRRLTRTALKHADLVLVRDEASADAFAQAGVEPPFRLGADPAWADLGQLYAAPTPADQVVVALDDTPRPDAAFSAALEPIAATGVGILLQPWRAGDSASRRTAERVASAISNGASRSAVDVVDAPVTLHDARDLYSGSRAVLALRFHAVMAAACAGSRTLAVGGPTIERLAGALGMPVVPAGWTPEHIAQALLHTLEQAPAAARGVPHLIERAKGSIDLVRLLVTEGADDTLSSAEPLPLHPEPWRP